MVFFCPLYRFYIVQVQSYDFHLQIREAWESVEHHVELKYKIIRNICDEKVCL